MYYSMVGWRDRGIQNALRKLEQTSRKKSFICHQADQTLYCRHNIDQAGWLTPRPQYVPKLYKYLAPIFDPEEYKNSIPTELLNKGFKGCRLHVLQATPVQGGLHSTPVGQDNAQASRDNSHAARLLLGSKDPPRREILSRLKRGLFPLSTQHMPLAPEKV